MLALFYSIAFLKAVSYTLIKLILYMFVNRV